LIGSDRKIIAMQHIQVIRKNGRALAAAMLDAIGDNKLDEAGIWLDKLKKLNDLTEEHPDILRFRTLIAIQRGKVDDALAHLNTLPHNLVPDMRVMCMLYSGDPEWEGLAKDLADNSPNAEVRSTMSVLLGREGSPSASWS
jgi:hypothetical protein